MIKIDKNTFLLIGWIISFSALAFAVLYNPVQSASVLQAQVIGNSSQLYVQFGCSHCATQESYFKGTIQYLNITDCYVNPQICNKLTINDTPTWKIDGKYYVGIKTPQEVIKSKRPLEPVSSKHFRIIFVALVQ
jgi:regulation of enolase protein 1 (concanavalin A-like superfamily)